MKSNTFQLTFEQQFQMKVIEKSSQELSREQALDLLVQTSRLLMIKDNVIRDLIKQDVDRVIKPIFN